MFPGGRLRSTTIAAQAGFLYDLPIHHYEVGTEVSGRHLPLGTTQSECEKPILLISLLQHGTIV